MKKWIGILIIGLMVLPVSLIAEPIPSHIPGVKLIKIDLVKKWLDEGIEFTLLDARKPSQYQSGHLPEAYSCPVNLDRSLSEDAIQLSIQYLKKCSFLNDIKQHDKIVVYCNAPT